MSIVKWVMWFYALKANMQLRDVFVENLRKYRRERGISQATLAEKCGTSTSYIGQIEIGNRFPSLELIEKLARTLQIRPHLLFFIESDNDADEQLLKKKKETISDTMKDELTKRLTNAIHKVIKHID
jgi:transcriptional regulator with XRE-family HTH domain